jgi:hypothetical protein
MAEGIVYLDVDDEITSAASRIRTAAGTKVALVVPSGSRIATSRINFRLLSREALVSNRRLSVIAGDAASRALAASAGLPVFATIAEYEAALAGPRPPDDDGIAPATIDDGADRDAEPPAEPARRRRSKRGAAAAASAPGAGAAPMVAPSSPVASHVLDATTSMALPSERSVHIGDEPVVAERDRPPVATGSRRLPRTPVLAAAGVLALAAVVVASGAYLLLPSATIALTPRRDTIGPISLTIAADPAATAVDAKNGVVPALKLEVPVEVNRTFTTTGTHVELAAATGSVEFSNYDPTASNTIASGSIVSTEGGIRFRTLATVTLPPGTFVLPNVIPSRRTVHVKAVKDGTAGNVPANAIRVVPRGENPDFLKVNNPDPTSGGTRKETPEVKKAEVDQAVAAVQQALRAQFDGAVAGGAGAPAGAELFPQTASLGTPTFSVVPAKLIGQAVESFDLGAAATGTVIAVDPSPIRSIAEARLRDRIGSDHRLIDGSITIDVGDGSVGEDGQVAFEATARAARVIVVDPSQLSALVKGKSAADAEAALAPYGGATVVLWPSWVTTVTGVDARLSISIDESTSGGGASAPPSGASPAGSSPARSVPASSRPSRSPGSAAP